ncbi:protein translocase subunit SecD [Segeticoccus rhizosphaerae]|uniref:protein translocase subunit SecD n=1 Tax=Segeticoccus rhizosphaerae TaxID=1104777 RepID=UPI0010C03C98|nr:protein translocase subunit SecD [Ornithinicoccus soli]
MAIKPQNRTPLKTLALLVLLILGLFGGIVAASGAGNPVDAWRPKLGLDLEGGRQIVLAPVIEGGKQINSQQVTQAVSIIRQRVDGSGVSEAEVTTLGQSNIVVSLPGNPDQATLDSLKQSSQLRFRAVICASSSPGVPAGCPSPQAAQPAPSGTSTPKASGEATGTPSVKSTPTASSKATSAPRKSTPSPKKTSSAGAAVPQALRADSTPSPSGTATASKTATATPSGASTATPTASASPGQEQPQTKPKNASDVAWVTPALTKAYQQLNCKTAKGREQALAPVDKPMVACQTDGREKFILGPSEVTGAHISDASAGYQTGQNGVQTSVVEVALSFDKVGAQQFEKVTARLTPHPEGDPQKRFAIVLDGQVISAPQSQAVIRDGRASITGNFTLDSAKLLADQLKFGALPMSFQVQTSEQISPQLGSEQLKMGIIAGMIGLLLVVIYSLLQYRALGFVTVCSLAIAGLSSYGLVTLLGYTHNFRLTMAGVTGLIVSIGITADSFIVYFERVRDEVRDGRRLRSAVETGWGRARRTILISDGINFLAAAILYVLSESSVKAFAFTLGLTTLVDVVVVVLFTHPLLTILSSTEFFGQGHKWSGFDPVRLGAKKITYAGRGRVSIAGQRPAEGGTA